jgi:hypothetical protein
VDRPAARVDRGVDGVLLGEVDLDRLDAGQLHLGEVHHHDLGAGVQQQLGGRCAHPGGASDHHHALPVVPKGVEQRHVIFS